MGSIGKILGQANPGAILTALYTTPNGVITTLSVKVCNTNGFIETFRISVALAGAVDSLKQYLIYDKTIAANESDEISGVYLKSGDVVRVYASDAAVVFSAIGVESN